jgi:uncharacterized membrane protein YeaQ/YmgE (transglycosylase-associated protein family)
VSFSLPQIITWLVVGLLGGSAAAVVVKRERHGFGWLLNLALGVVGAVVGGAIFRLFGILDSLDKISISLRDLLSAFLGSLIVLTVIWAWRQYSGRS